MFWHEGGEISHCGGTQWTELLEIVLGNKLEAEDDDEEWGSTGTVNRVNWYVGTIDIKNKSNENIVGGDGDEDD